MLFEFDDETENYDSFILSGMESQWNSLVYDWENQNLSDASDDEMTLNRFLQIVFYSNNKNTQQLQMGLLNLGLNYNNFNIKKWKDIKSRISQSCN